MTQRDDATQRQIAAARPQASSWVSANAGSGKTRVLTDRVARLLLEDVKPQHILCLTYTKAAASEMQNRLFKRLGQWAMLADHTLERELVDLGLPGPFSPQALRHARTLFASAIETPGGLKIQTIHSFCASLLRRFPLEARVNPQFSEMDDRSAALLQADILRQIADGPNAGVVRSLAYYFTGVDFEDLTRALVGKRSFFSAPLDWPGCLCHFGLNRDYSGEMLLSEVYLGDEEDILAELLPKLAASSANDVKDGTKLRSLKVGALSSLPILENVFLYGATAMAGPFTAKLGKFPTAPLRKANPDLIERVENWMRRVEDSRQRRLALAAAQKTQALHDFARLFLPAYEAAKQVRGWLDFDDLIFKARDLLTDPTVATWVLYRLDGGIDHILVDEAQDTSPAQWKVIELLAQEFTSGQGARSDVPRTIFVVGDKKQSIYSFQGADPREFDRMQAEFDARLQNTNTPLASLELEFSFRSASCILDIVDQVFTEREASGFNPESRHKAFKHRMPGRVDLWPAIEAVDETEDGVWFEPVDRVGQESHVVQLANRIADEIADMIDRGETIPEEVENTGTYQRRVVRPGDFLILVQRRAALFHEIIRACKARNLAIAGADRLKVGAELAVRDLAAMLTVVATPEDDLSLATVLKSPLFGWTEQQLFDLAHRRSKKFLWQALRDRREEFPDVLAVLDDLRDVSDYLRPFELIERILTRHHGRDKILSRLGVEAEDGIDAFLAQALTFEQTTVPSLIGFLQWMQTDDLEIKRQMDSASDRIRVMTVHGAKGLEAPIVILPDAATRRPQSRDDLIEVGDTVLWKPRADDMPDLIKSAMDDAKQAEAAERDRLLYVAMTRAEKWLIVTAAGKLGEEDTSWYNQTLSAMTALGAASHKCSFGQGLRLSNGDWDGPALMQSKPTEAPDVSLASHFSKAAPAVDAKIKTLSPSDLGGAKALQGDLGLDEDAALRRGRQIHRLLEHLPRAEPFRWPDFAAQLLARGEDRATDEDLHELLAEARQVLVSPDLAPLFRADALAEVSVTANLAQLGNNRIHGTIDRLLVDDVRVLAVDFKTNAIVPTMPERVPLGLLRQMGAYAHALAQIYPNHRIETALLWTKSATLMTLPHDLVTDALQNATVP